MPTYEVDSGRIAATRSAQPRDDSDSDGGMASDDEGELSLLGPGGQSRRRSLSVVGASTTWKQVKDIVIETAPTLLFTTIGLLFTGELLDHVSYWKAMRRVDELIIIIPVILNLKGNLEMNLSSRLGTAANVGGLDDKASRYGILLGNMALLQVQASLVSFTAAILSFMLGLIVPTPDFPSVASSVATNSEVRYRFARRPLPKIPDSSERLKSGLAEFILVVSTAMTSACLSSLILGSFMCTLVILCRKFALNPDNIAPPIASCLGDLVTLCLLGLTSTVLINFVNTPLPFIMSILVALFACFCAFLVNRNNSVRALIFQGWTPLFAAMFISTSTGIILDLFVSRYSGFALLATIISGLPGAVGSVAISRISTDLHAAAMSIFTVPEHKRDGPPHPSLKLMMTTLFIITIPVEIVFLTLLRSIGWLTLPAVFVTSSVVFFCVASMISLWFARYLTNLLWQWGRDPDIYAMPIHSSLIDLVGQMLLVICFELISLLGYPVRAGKGQ